MSAPDRDALLARARELEAQGYERGPVVDAARKQELLDLYAELGQDAVALDGAVPAEDQECTQCLVGAGLVTIYVRRS